jgi:hypothetical protein
MWEASRARPGGASETAAPEYDARLESGAAGYQRRARFEARLFEGHPWQALRMANDPASDRLLAGPTVTIYERTGGAR